MHLFFKQIMKKLFRLFKNRIKLIKILLKMKKIKMRLFFFIKKRLKKRIKKQISAYRKRNNLI